MSVVPEPSAFSFVAHGPSAEFVSSLSVDRRLAAADIAASLAHVATLEAAGLASGPEAKRIAAALRTSRLSW